MKKNIKSKRHALEQDTGAINNLVKILEEDDDFVQKTEVILIDIDAFTCKQEIITKLATPVGKSEKVKNIVSKNDKKE